MKPCSECPYSKNTPPGTLGGSDVSTYIGQAIGPFFLPCHLSPGYYEDKRSRKHLQCTGAAIFRTHLGVDHLMPKEITTLAVDRENVFSTCAELVAHHRKISLDMAEGFLEGFPPLEMFRKELEKPEVEFTKCKSTKP